MEILHTAHSWVRYLVLIAGVLAIATALMAMVRPVEGDRPSRIGLAAFAGVLDLQVVLGIILLIVWPYYPMLIGHIVMMVLAAVVAHAGSVMARRRVQRSQSAAGVRLATAVLAIIMVVGGIMAIQRPLI
jgi:hypothetical protein